MSAPVPARQRRWVANAIWTIVGVGLYTISVNMYSGYPRRHTQALTWIAVVVIVVLGALVWRWHERHHDEP
jgi:hypothetical protein